MAESSSVPIYPGLEIGHTVVLELDDRGRRRSYPTRVLEAGRDLIWLETPADYAVPTHVIEAPIRLFKRLADAFAAPSDDAATSVVVHTWQLMDARYTLRGRLVASRPTPRPQVAVRIFESERVQDREYFRVSMEAQASATAEGPDGEAWLFALSIADLSAAGLRAHSQLPLAQGTELRIKLRLRGRSEALDLRGRVMRVVEPPRPPRLSCVIGVAFVDLSEREREELIRFVLNAQIEQRRRGRV